MVVLSFRMKKKGILALCAIGFVVLALFLGVRFLKGPEDGTQIKSRKAAGQTQQERLDFLASFGWEASAEPPQVQEVTIPQEFDTVYQEYNDLQKTQGMDLSRWAGQRCKKYRYHLVNYPGQTENAYATLLVADGRIIGGDVTVTGEDGFTHGFSLSAQTGGNALPDVLS